jgi:hypothetical protein
VDDPACKQPATEGNSRTGDHVHKIVATFDGDGQEHEPIESCAGPAEIRYRAEGEEQQNGADSVETRKRDEPLRAREVDNPHSPVAQGCGMFLKF